MHDGSKCSLPEVQEQGSNSNIKNVKYVIYILMKGVVKLQRFTSDFAKSYYIGKISRYQKVREGRRRKGKGMKFKREIEG